MPKQTDKIIMSKMDLAAEHKKLIQLLRHGTRPQLLREANAQAKEAVKYKK
tara:strand:+ start:1007 stop:1159 length:153 start_codon:yes stop_codon:yes gene_type:complete